MLCVRVLLFMCVGAPINFYSIYFEMEFLLVGLVVLVLSL